ncbi:hypothetical protein EDB86DRAFT_3129344 [Lactarius hatsudake]|nr:hypothetical protein EDB86DRAFT_3129344 [Lactarius hatsudake]
MRGSFLGFTVEEMVCLSTFAPMAVCSPVNSPSRGTSRVTVTAYGRILGEQVWSPFFAECALKHHNLPMGESSLYAARSGRYRLCLSRVRWGVGSFSCPLSVIFLAHASIFGVQYLPCVVPCALSLISPPPRPSYAASRLDFWALAADLFMGLATSTESRSWICLLWQATHAIRQTQDQRNRPFGSGWSYHHHKYGVGSRVLPAFWHN